MQRFYTTYNHYYNLLMFHVILKLRKSVFIYFIIFILYVIKIFNKYIYNNIADLMCYEKYKEITL